MCGPRTIAHSTMIESLAASVVNGLPSSLSASFQARARKNRIVQSDTEKLSLSNAVDQKNIKLSVDVI